MPSKLEVAIERLTGVIGMLKNQVEKLDNTLGRVVFPAEAIGELVGELRAMRYLLDNKGEFSFMEKAKAKSNLEKVKKAGK